MFGNAVDLSPKQNEISSGNDYNKFPDSDEEKGIQVAGFD